jgi:hypothetical protein
MSYLSPKLIIRLSLLILDHHFLKIKHFFKIHIHLMFARSALSKILLICQLPENSESEFVVRLPGFYPSIRWQIPMIWMIGPELRIPKNGESYISSQKKSCMSISSLFAQNLDSHCRIREFAAVKSSHPSP